MDMPDTEEVQQEKAKDELPFLFNVPAHPRSLEKRTRLSLDHDPTDSWSFYRGVQTLCRFLEHLDDYDLVKAVCGIDPADPEQQGVGALYSAIVATTTTRLYQRFDPQTYQDWLFVLEREVQRYQMDKKDRYLVRSTSFLYSYERVQRHPYAFLLYALALALLGKETYSLAQEFLHEAYLWDSECPGLSWARHELSLLEMNRRYEYR